MFWGKTIFNFGAIIQPRSVNLFMVSPSKSPFLSAGNYSLSSLHEGADSWHDSKKSRTGSLRVVVCWVLNARKLKQLNELDTCQGVVKKKQAAGLNSRLGVDEARERERPMELPSKGLMCLLYWHLLWAHSDAEVHFESWINSVMLDQMWPEHHMGALIYLIFDKNWLTELIHKGIILLGYGLSWMLESAVIFIH